MQHSRQSLEKLSRTSLLALKDCPSLSLQEELLQYEKTAISQLLADQQFKPQLYFDSKLSGTNNLSVLNYILHKALSSYRRRIAHLDLYKYLTPVIHRLNSKHNNEDLISCSNQNLSFSGFMSLLHNEETRVAEQNKSILYRATFQKQLYSFASNPELYPDKYDHLIGDLLLLRCLRELPEECQPQQQLRGVTENQYSKTDSDPHGCPQLRSGYELSGSRFDRFPYPKLYRCLPEQQSCRSRVQRFDRPVVGKRPQTKTNTHNDYDDRPIFDFFSECCKKSDYNGDQLLINHTTATSKFNTNNQLKLSRSKILADRTPRYGALDSRMELQANQYANRQSSTCPLEKFLSPQNLELNMSDHSSIQKYTYQTDHAVNPQSEYSGHNGFEKMDYLSGEEAMRSMQKSKHS